MTNKLDLLRTALMIIDMQNDFLHPDGFVMKHKSLLGFKAELMASSIPNVCRLLDEARAKSLKVIHIFGAWEPDFSDAAIPISLPPEIEEKNLLIKGSWGAEIIKELTPEKGEYIVCKKGYGAFFQTHLDRLLRNLNIEMLIICGIMTNVCVETTAREAIALGYKIILTSDATATVDEEMHRATLKTIGMFFGEVKSTEEVIESLSSG